jgi:hypothetical protein
MKPIFRESHISKSIIPLCAMSAQLQPRIFNSSGRPGKKVYVNGARSSSIPNELLNLSKILAF